MIISEDSAEPSRLWPLAMAPGAPVRYDAAVCLPARLVDNECGLCAAACPVAAITLHDGLPRLTGRCVGCGACAAACPTQAIEVDGFDNAQMLPGAGPVQVDCDRVQHQDSPAGVIRVPCLGGLSTDDLLAMVDAAQGRTIQLLDRGACTTCPAGGAMDSLRHSLHEVAALLQAVGVEGDCLPSFAQKPCRRPLLAIAVGSKPPEKLGRREFFLRVFNAPDSVDATRAADAAADLTRKRRSRAPIVPQRRLHSLAVLGRLADRHGQELPSQLFPQLNWSPCSAHGICARVCPTGALTRVDEEAGARLQFDSTTCIACGQCARACPEHALRLVPEGGGAGRDTLAKWPIRYCSVCGDSFLATDSASVCAACERDRALSQDLQSLWAGQDAQPPRL